MMSTPVRTYRLTTVIAAACAFLWASGACSGPEDAFGPSDSGASPPPDSGLKAGEDAGAEDSGHTHWAVCPDGLEPRFSSIQEKVFFTSCGTQGGACHSSAGAVFSGGMDLQRDAWTNLLGPDGGGARSNNIEGSEKALLRVAPFSPNDSFLLIKLRTTSSSDPAYGSGMPFGQPGSVCPQTLETIAQWIDAGAPND